MAYYRLIIGYINEFIIGLQMCNTVNRLSKYRQKSKRNINPIISADCSSYFSV